MWQQLTESHQYRTAGLFKSIFSLIFSTALLVTANAQPPERRLYKVHNAENRTGFIDNSGKLVIGFDLFPAGTQIDNFSDGLARICIPDAEQGRCKRAGYIDQTGKIVIAPRFGTAHGFSEGLAVVETETQVGFINRRGEVEIKLDSSNALGFSDGIAPVLTSKGWGFIDRTGKFISSERYRHVQRFSEGLAAVANGHGPRAKYGFINKNGEVVIPLRYDPPIGAYSNILDLRRFSEGLAAVRIGNLYSYIDKKGDIAIPAQFRDAAEFSEGLASVTTPEGQSGYIDRAGRFVIKLKSGGGYNFSEGLAAWAVQTDRGLKLGYIDRTGKVVIEPKYDGAFGFVDGVAEVFIREIVTTASGRMSQTRIGYIDKTGRYIWPPQ